MHIDSTTLPRRVRFACQDCDELLSGYEGCDGLCPDCGCEQTAPEAVH